MASLLTRHTDSEQLPLETVMQYVTQIADTLQYAHDKHHHYPLRPQTGQCAE